MKISEAIEKFTKLPTAKNLFLGMWMFATVIYLGSYSSEIISKTAEPQSPASLMSVIIMLLSVILGVYYNGILINLVKKIATKETNTLSIKELQNKAFSIGFNYNIAMIGWLLIAIFVGVVIFTTLNILTSKLTAGITVSILILLSLGLFGYFLPAIYLNYCKTQKMSSVFNIEQIKTIAFASKMNYFKMLALTSLIGLVAMIIAWFTLLGSNIIAQIACLTAKINSNFTITTIASIIGLGISSIFTTTSGLLNTYLYAGYYIENNLSKAEA